MKKTAMQMLIDQIRDQQKKGTLHPEVLRATKVVIEAAEFLLPIESKQIMQAHIDGRKALLKNFNEPYEVQSSSDYFTQTYNP